MKYSRMALIGLIISFVTILVIIRLTETSLTWKALFSANWKYLSIAVLLQVLFLFLWGLRLKLIASCIGYDIPITYTFKISLASAFLAAITPSSAGGEPLRIKMLANSGANYGEATAAVLAERVLDAVFFSISLPIFVLISGITTGLRVALIFAFFFSTFLLILYAIFKDEGNIKKISSFVYWIVSKVKDEKLGKRVSNRAESEMMNFRLAAIELLKNRFHRILALFISTVLIWTSLFLIPSFILLSLNCEPFFLLSYTVQLIVCVISLIPLTPGSSGIAEVSAAYFYSSFIPSHLLGTLIGIWRVVTYYFSMLIGFLANVSIIRDLQKAKCVVESPE